MKWIIFFSSSWISRQTQEKESVSACWQVYDLLEWPTHHFGPWSIIVQHSRRGKKRNKGKKARREGAQSFPFDLFVVPETTLLASADSSSPILQFGRDDSRVRTTFSSTANSPWMTSICSAGFVTVFYLTPLLYHGNIVYRSSFRRTKMNHSLDCECDFS